MTEKDCVFCKIVRGEIPAHIIYEDKDVLAFLDVNPVNPGHVLIIPKEHYIDMAETPDKFVCKVMVVAKKVGKKVLETGLGQGFNIGVNTKKAAGQVVEHFHLHVMPRLDGDGLKLWPGKIYANSEAKLLAEKLHID